MKTYIATFAVGIALLSSGCVVGQRTIDLTIPQATSYPKSQGSILVGQVHDERQFANKPSDPSTPSVDGDVTQLNATTKALMIGRQRNGYGMAMGDIALPKDRSVILLTRELLIESLKRNGYSVSTTEADRSIDVNIDEFWAWFSPGMWSVSFEARVYCTLIVKQNSDLKTVVIRGYGINKGQVASDANWKLAYQRAFEDFLSKSSAELKGAGL
jgi:hypothetical protein